MCSFVAELLLEQYALAATIYLEPPHMLRKNRLAAAFANSLIQRTTWWLWVLSNKRT